MKSAPISLQRLMFRRVLVEVHPDQIEHDSKDELDHSLAFDNVPITTHVGVNRSAEDPGEYFLHMQVKIENLAEPDQTARASIYLIDIEAGAIFKVADAMRNHPEIHDIVAVNGASMLWSAIREQVSTLTARMPPGMAILPTVQFNDLRHQTPSTQAPTDSARTDSAND